MRVTGTTKVVGLFGHPVEHTLSPLIHNAAFQETGIDWIYCAFPVRPLHLREACQAIRVLSMPGVNVTVPHKERVVDYLDRLSPEAEAIGAVNTVVNEDGVLVGYNTDATGFIRSLEGSYFSLIGKTVLMVGAGGAALAVGYALVTGGVGRLFILNRTRLRAVSLASRLERLGKAVRIEWLPWQQRNPLSCAAEIDLVINTTSCGMKPGRAVIDVDQFSPGVHVYDLVYNRVTELLQAGLQRGLKCIDGREMLLHQGAEAFSLWTKRDAPLAAMRRAIGEYLRGAG